jgi:hypothetical protein
MDPFILNLDTRWTSVASFMSRSFFPEERPPVTIQEEDEWNLQPVWVLWRE